MGTSMSMLGRQFILAVAAIAFGMKFLWTFGAELHSTGGDAFYHLIMHDVSVVMLFWTAILMATALLMGEAKMSDLGSVKWLYGAYSTAGAAVALYFALNDFFAAGGHVGGASMWLEISLVVNVLTVACLGKQLWDFMRSFASEVVAGASNF